VKDEISLCLAVSWSAKCWRDGDFGRLRIWTEN